MMPQSAAYDLYLTTGCATPPDLGAFERDAPALGEPALRARLLRRLPGPGFLGLDLGEARARALLGQLAAAGARGEALPAAYRRPLLTVETAWPLAERDLVPRAAEAFPGYSFEPVRYWREGARWFVFGMIAPALVERGHVPGGVLAYVDKVDGHLWRPDELERLAPGR
jgi:hypothetical protein